VFKKFRSKGYEIWLVGAGVRNLLLGREILDPDFTTKATPEEIQKLFPDSFYDNLFGTVGIPVKGKGEKAKDKTEVFEITTYRTEEGYSDRRRPDRVVWGKTLEEDLGRRDFTINAMVIGPTKLKGEKKDSLVLRDMFKGQEDLEDKVIRAVGKAEERFEEDALRMMRAIRIGSQLAFKIEKKTLAAIQKKAGLLKLISRERVRDELIKILASDYPADGVLLLHSAGLLPYILPELLEMRGIKQIGHHIYDVWTHSIESLRHCPSQDPIVRLATLLHDVGKPPTAQPRDGKEVTFYGHEVVGARLARQIAKRLRLAKKEQERIYTLVRWHMFAYEPKMTDAAIRRFIRRVGVENVNDMMMLRVGDRKGGGSKATSWRLRELQKRIGEQLYEPLTVKDLKVDGNEVMKVLKIKPGPKVGEVLNQLFEEVLEDPKKNTKKYLRERTKELA
jgi:tRNA nucleotidyltransferase (CCA-adding enzyme)